MRIVVGEMHITFFHRVQLALTHAGVERESDHHPIDERDRRAFNQRAHLGIGEHGPRIARRLVTPRQLEPRERIEINSPLVHRKLQTPAQKVQRVLHHGARQRLAPRSVLLVHPRHPGARLSPADHDQRQRADRIAFHMHTHARSLARHVAVAK
jgi:hypothetical protein